jgi:3',5'-nucleoside bisphosphate phosphatase
MIDLHTHSIFSDGSLTPEELADKAKATGLTAIALTDHDCTDGLPRFIAACERNSITGVPGVEISIEMQKGTMHVLGYYIDGSNAGLQDALVKICNGRESRNTEILKKLNDLGFSLKWEEVTAFAGGEVVGRPHFSQALIAKGYVADKEEAFEKYLAKGKPCYADRYRFEDVEAIDIIRKAGGVPVLAHPSSLKLGDSKLKEKLADLKSMGLAGMEIFYSEHSPEMVRNYLAMAAELDLIATGGSDFHGAANPKIQLGRGFGNLNIPDDIVGKLLEWKQG